MRSQPSLRPFDVAVALQLLKAPEERYEPLATSLVTSTSAVHRAVARLQLAGLCVQKQRTIEKEAFWEFLLHGIRFVFPPVFGSERTGMPTAWSHGGVHNQLGSAVIPSRSFVWASETGSSRGETIVPLFPNVPAVVAKDSALHELLAAIDVFRVGNATLREAMMGVWRRTAFGTHLGT